MEDNIYFTSVLYYENFKVIGNGFNQIITRNMVATFMPYTQWNFSQHAVSHLHVEFVYNTIQVSVFSFISLSQLYIVISLILVSVDISLFVPSR